MQAQWIVTLVRQSAAEVQAANPGWIPRLFRDGRKLATLLYLDQLPTRTAWKKKRETFRSHG